MKQHDARERMIKAAIDLFYKKGYPATTTRDIGNKADISTSVIYHYFKDKEELGRRISDLLRSNDLILIKGSRATKMEDIINLI